MTTMEGEGSSKDFPTGKIICISRGDSVPNGFTTINVTSKSANPATRKFSPFFLGPCTIRPQGDEIQAQCMENAWQYSKVYADQVDEFGNPTDVWTQWSTQGFLANNAKRYPKGLGAKPLYSLHDGIKLGYVEARIKIYAPLYATLAEEYCTDELEVLRERYHSGENLALWDYDGYCHQLAGLQLSDVLYNTRRKMGHCFVIVGLITGDRFWETEYDESREIKKSIPRAKKDSQICH